MGLDTVQDDLVGVVYQAFEPAHVSVGLASTSTNNVQWVDRTERILVNSERIVRASVTPRLGRIVKLRSFTAAVEP